MEKSNRLRAWLNRIFHLAGFLFFLSCSSENPDVSQLKKQVNINRIDKKVFSCQSKKELSTVIQENQRQFELFYNLSAFPSDTILSNVLWKRVQDRSIDSFYNYYLEEFDDLSWLEEESSLLFAHVKYYYPDFVSPGISTFFSAYLDRDIMMNDLDVAISLDFFLGPEAKYLPRLPEYMARRYRREYLVPMFIGSSISQSYNRVSQADGSLLAEMIYYGKTHLFVEQMIPGLADSLNFGFSQSELDYLENNFKEIWGYFIERDLLYTRNYSEINRYVGERPKTVEIGPDCPGRVGRFIGYQIVKSYLKSSDQIDITSVMANPDAQEIFRESGFNPSKLPG